MGGKNLFLPSTIRFFTALPSHSRLIILLLSFCARSFSFNSTLMLFSDFLLTLLLVIAPVTLILEAKMESTENCQFSWWSLVGYAHFLSFHFPLFISLTWTSPVFPDFQFASKVSAHMIHLTPHNTVLSTLTWFYLNFKVFLDRIDVCWPWSGCFQAWNNQAYLIQFVCMCPRSLFWMTLLPWLCIH